MPFVPKTPKGNNTPVKHQRPHTHNQQTSTAVRPPLPRDVSMGNNVNWNPGELPKGGYQSIWRFDGGTDTKRSPTVCMGRKVY